MRERATLAEQILWQKLKQKKIMGYKFRRQHSIGSYVVDFYCADLKLVIEVDGGYHNKKDQRDYDLDRQENVAIFGIRFLRFKNNDIINEPTEVIRKIINFINASP